MAALAIVVVLAIPVAVLIALLRLVTVLEMRRQALGSRQIALTDAIHGALGPVVAPVVRRGRSGWIGVLPVAAGDPDVARMVEIAQAELGRIRRRVAPAARRRRLRSLPRTGRGSPR